MAAKMSAILYFVSVILSQTTGRMANGFRERSPYESFEETFGDYLNEAKLKKEVKRHPPAGSCTCTCETKPVSGTRKNFPEAAAMIRTAVKPDMASSSKVKEQVAARFHPSDSLKAEGHWQTDDQRSKIVKADPWDYTHILNGYNDDVTNSVESPDDEHGKEESKASDADEADSNNADSWGHESRFPWKNLPDKVCYRQSCSHDRQCCRRYNLCDKSANVCTDCWHGSNCNSEADCCERFPYCQRSKSLMSGSIGKCVDELKKNRDD